MGLYIYMVYEAMYVRITLGGYIFIRTEARFVYQISNGITLLPLEYIFFWDRKEIEHKFENNPVTN